MIREFHLRAQISKLKKIYSIGPFHMIIIILFSQIYKLVWILEILNMVFIVIFYLSLYLEITV